MVNKRTVKGVVKVDERNGRIVAELSPDFVYYYLWFIARQTKQLFSPPRHGAHVTIALRKLHDVYWDLAYKLYNGKTINVDYEPFLIQGGGRRGFVNFWMRVRSKDIDSIKRELNIRDGDGYQGLHVTICNNKNQASRPWWPELITIQK